MALYAFIGIDHPPHSMALRDELREKHRSYVLNNDASIRTAGALYDPDGNQCGSLLLFETDTPGQVREWLRAEPYYAGGVYQSCHVIEWRMALNLLPQTGGWVLAGSQPAE